MHVMSQSHELDCSLDISHLSTACTPLVSDEHFLTTSTMHNTCTLVSKTIQCCDTSEEFIIPNDNYYSYRMLHTMSQQGVIATSPLLDSQLYSLTTVARLSNFYSSKSKHELELNYLRQLCCNSLSDLYLFSNDFFNKVLTFFSFPLPPQAFILSLSCS